MNKEEYLCMQYSKDPTKCNMKEMSDIGPVGQTMQVSDKKGNTWGGTLHLYQCPDCKQVKLLLPK